MKPIMRGPLLAMAMSARFEGKSWSVIGIAGVALVLLGQRMRLRTRSRSGPAE